jgi:DNA-binding NarL/FixJ family response regulator
MTKPAILIVDDHPMFLEALQSAVAAAHPELHIDSAETVAAAKGLLRTNRYVVVLLDLKLPDANGLDALREIRAHSKGAAVAVISALNSPDIVLQAKSSGAQGYIYKSQKREVIISQISQLLAGETVFPPVDDIALRVSPENIVERLRQLTPQQLKVLQRVCEAKLNKQIAFELGVTETTVKAHITLIFKKLGVHSRTQAVLQLQRLKSELEGGEFDELLQWA